MPDTTVYEDIKRKIAYAKQSYPYGTQNMLYEQLGAIKMAYRLGAITTEQFLELDKECVRKGINNPEFFDK